MSQKERSDTSPVEFLLVLLKVTSFVIHSLCSFTAVPNTFTPAAGEVQALSHSPSCSYAAFGADLRTSSTVVSLLDSVSLPQVLCSHLFAVDLLNNSAWEPALFSIMESFTHHPACSTKDNEIHSGDHAQEQELAGSRTIVGSLEKV